MHIRKTVVGEPEGKRPLVTPCVDAKILHVLNKFGMRAWSGLM